LHVLGSAVEPCPPHAGGRIALEAELGREYHPTVERLQRFANELLVGEWAVDLRRVEERHTAFDRRANERDHLLPIRRRPVAEAHAHTAEPEGGDFEPLSQRTLWDHSTSFFAKSAFARFTADIAFGHPT